MQLNKVTWYGETWKRHIPQLLWQICHPVLIILVILIRIHCNFRGHSFVSVLCLPKFPLTCTSRNPVVSTHDTTSLQIIPIGSSISSRQKLSNRNSDTSIKANNNVGISPKFAFPGFAIVFTLDRLKKCLYLLWLTLDQLSLALL